jgi:hypothetical protein
MTAIADVKKYLAHIPEGKPFSASTLRQFGATENVRQALVRFVCVKHFVGR